MKIDSERNFNLWAHHYNYYEPGDQPEGIRERIRQGIGGPRFLEPGANVHGHLHLPEGQKVRMNIDVVVMDFNDERWEVKLDHPPLCFCGEDGMIDQDEDGITGHEIEGYCVKRVEGSPIHVNPKIVLYKSGEFLKPDRIKIEAPSREATTDIITNKCPDCSFRENVCNGMKDNGRAKLDSYLVSGKILSKIKKKAPCQPLLD